MQFEWDENKNILNKQKYDINFEQAVDVFQDPLHISLLDKRFSYFEERWITLGATKLQAILVVANLFYTDEGEEIIRLVSARPATAKERQQYENT